MKKRFALMLSAFLTLGLVSPVNAIDYSEDEDYWYESCNGRLSPDMLKACQGFTEYLENKQSDLEGKLEDLDSQIEELKGDIEKLVSLTKEIQKDIDKKDEAINKKITQIKRLEENIEKLEKEIEIKEKDIETRNTQIKERMVQTQTFNNTLGYIDFIMGATDFVDMIRRISIMNQITAYEQEQIRLLNEDIKVLNHDKEEIEVQKKGLEVQKATLDKEKADLEAYKKRQNQLIAQYKQKEEELMDAYMKSEESIASIKNSMPSYSAADGSPADTSSFGRVVDGYVSATTWYYPASFGGGRHSGLDIAGPEGTPVLAAFNGVVAIAQNVTNKGGLGTRPYTGNNVMLIGTVDGVTYAIHMMHLQYNTITVNVGDRVTKGQMVARRGTTGNSSGPHVHIDLYNLGSMSIESAYNYVRNTGTYTFGMPYKAVGWECSNKAPVCREAPQDKIPN